MWSLSKRGRTARLVPVQLVNQHPYESRHKQCCSRRWRIQGRHERIGRHPTINPNRVEAFRSPSIILISSSSQSWTVSARWRMSEATAASSSRATGTCSSSGRSSRRKRGRGPRAPPRCSMARSCCLEPSGRNVPGALGPVAAPSVAAALATCGDVNSARSPQSDPGRRPATLKEAIAPAVLAAPRHTDISLRHARTRAVAERR